MWHAWNRSMVIGLNPIWIIKSQMSRPKVRFFLKPYWTATNVKTKGKVLFKTLLDGPPSMIRSTDLMLNAMIWRKYADDTSECKADLQAQQQQAQWASCTLFNSDPDAVTKHETVLAKKWMRNQAEVNKMVPCRQMCQPRRMNVDWIHQSKKSNAC